MKPRRNNKVVIDDGHMDPVEVFARIKTVTEDDKDVSRFVSYFF